MKNIFFSILMCFVFVAVVYAQPALGKDSFNLLTSPVPTPTKQPDYTEICKRAIDENKFLIIWVGVKPIDNPSLLHYETDTFDGCKGPAVVVVIPYRDVLHRTDLPPTATNNEICQTALALWHQAKRTYDQQNQKSFLPISVPFKVQPKNC